MRFTAIYEERWKVRQTWHCKANHMKLSTRAGETVIDTLYRVGIAEKTFFVLKGWPAIVELSELITAMTNKGVDHGQ